MSYGLGFSHGVVSKRCQTVVEGERSGRFSRREHNHVIVIGGKGALWTFSFSCEGGLNK